MPDNTDNKEFSIYPKLSSIAEDLLKMCKSNGVYDNELGKNVLQKLEDHFNGIEIDDKDLADAASAWYEGTFCPGFYMNDNDSEFADYLKSKISMKVYSD